MNRRNLLALFAAVPVVANLGAFAPAVASTPGPFVISAGGNGLSLSLLRRAIAATPDASGLIMSKMMRNLLNVHRGATVWDKNEEGTRVAFFDDLLIHTTDYDADGTQVIGFDEKYDDLLNTTSIYILGSTDSEDFRRLNLYDTYARRLDDWAAKQRLFLMSDKEIFDAHRKIKQEMMSDIADKARELMQSEDVVRICGIRRSAVEV